MALYLNIYPKFPISHLHLIYKYKRFISQTVISNSSYYDGKLDVELHPVFDTLFRLSRIHEQNKLTIEPPKTQSKCTKKAPEGANFKNGGNDEARTRDLMRDRHAL